jgi:hypothetical protein
MRQQLDRRPPQFRRGFWESLNVLRLPATGNKEIGAFWGPNLNAALASLSCLPVERGISELFRSEINQRVSNLKANGSRNNASG